MFGSGRPSSSVHLMQQTNTPKTATLWKKRKNKTNKTVKLNTFMAESQYQYKEVEVEIQFDHTRIAH
jgi:hypothetical protein